MLNITTTDFVLLSAVDESANDASNNNRAPMQFAYHYRQGIRQSHCNNPKREKKGQSFRGFTVGQSAKTLSSMQTTSTLLVAAACGAPYKTQTYSFKHLLC